MNSSSCATARQFLKRWTCGCCQVLCTCQHCHQTSESQPRFVSSFFADDSGQFLSTLWILTSALRPNLIAGHGPTWRGSAERNGAEPVCPLLDERKSTRWSDFHRKHPGGRETLWENNWPTSGSGFKGTNTSGRNARSVRVRVRLLGLSCFPFLIFQFSSFELFDLFCF